MPITKQDIIREYLRRRALRGDTTATASEFYHPNDPNAVRRQPRYPQPAPVQQRPAQQAASNAPDELTQLKLALVRLLLPGGAKPAVAPATPVAQPAMAPAMPGPESMGTPTNPLAGFMETDPELTAPPPPVSPVVKNPNPTRPLYRATEIGQAPLVADERVQGTMENVPTKNLGWLSGPMNAKQNPNSFFWELPENEQKQAWRMMAIGTPEAREAVKQRFGFDPVTDYPFIPEGKLAGFVNSALAGLTSSPAEPVENAGAVAPFLGGLIGEGAKYAGLMSLGVGPLGAAATSAGLRYAQDPESIKLPNDPHQSGTDALLKLLGNPIVETALGGLTSGAVRKPSPKGAATAAAESIPIEQQIAESMGAKFTGYLELAPGRRVINIHDPVTQGDYNVKTPGEIAAKIDSKRAEFAAGKAAREQAAAQQAAAQGTKLLDNGIQENGYYAYETGLGAADNRVPVAGQIEQGDVSGAGNSQLTGEPNAVSGNAPVRTGAATDYGFDIQYASIDDANKYLHNMNRALEDNPYKASVTIPTPQELVGTRIFSSADGTSAVVLKPNGEVAFGYNAGKGGAGVRSQLNDAIKAGAKWCNAFNTVLPGKYGGYGFKPTYKIKFDPDQAPANWDYELYKRWQDGQPDVVFMEYDGVLRTEDEVQKMIGEMQYADSYPEDIIIDKYNPKAATPDITPDTPPDTPPVVPDATPDVANVSPATAPPITTQPATAPPITTGKAKGKTPKPKKILLRDVQAAHDKWAMDMQKWGENNLQTSRSLGAYQDIKAAYEAQQAANKGAAPKPQPPSPPIEVQQTTTKAGKPTKPQGKAGKPTKTQPEPKVEPTPVETPPAKPKPTKTKPATPEPQPEPTPAPKPKPKPKAKAKEFVQSDEHQAAMTQKTGKILGIPIGNMKYLSAIVDHINGASVGDVIAKYGVNGDSFAHMIAKAGGKSEVAKNMKKHGYAGKDAAQKLYDDVSNLLGESGKKGKGKKGESVTLQAGINPGAAFGLFAHGSPEWAEAVDATLARVRGAIPDKMRKAFGKAFVYGYGKPKEYLDLLDQRMINIGNRVRGVSELGKEAKSALDQRAATNSDIVGDFYDFLDPTARSETPRVRKAIASLSLDDEMKDIADRMRASLTETGNEAVDVGLFSEQTRSINQETYLRRYYNEHEAPRNGIVSRMFSKMRVKGVKRRKLETVAEREQAGLMVDPVYSFAKGQSHLVHDIETAKMFRAVADNAEWADDAFREGFHVDPLPNNPEYGALAGKYVHEGIYEDIMEIIGNGRRGGFTKAYDKILSAWKFGKTALNPATHGRNIFSNIILADFADLPLYRVHVWQRAAKDYFSKGAYYKEALDNGLLSGDWYGNEIRPLIEHITNTDKDIFSKAWDYAADSRVGKLMGKAGDLYQGEEHFFKLAVYINERMKGASEAAAKAHAQKFLFDYSKVTPFIKGVRRSPLGAPFITFTYKSLPVIGEVMLKRPLKFWKYAALAYGINQLSKDQLGLSDVDMRRIAKTNAGNGFWKILMPVRDKNNNPIMMDLTYNIPWGDIAESGWLGPPGFKVPPQIMGSNPFTRAILEPLFNRDPYTQRPLFRQSDDTGERLKLVGQRAYRSLMPSLLPGNYGGDALIGLMTGQPNFYGDQPDPRAVLPNKLLGLKFGSVDVDRELKVKMGDIDEEIHDLRVAHLSKMRDARLSQDDKDRLYEKFAEKMKRLVKKKIELSGVEVTGDE